MSAKDTFVNEYWAERQAKAQEAVTKKGIKETEEQLKKYYQRTMDRVIKEFENTYNKILIDTKNGATATPADLYKLDTYWKMQVQARKELEKLGDKQAATMSRQFMNQFKGIYRTMALQDGGSFSQISNETAEQMIKAIWCADGKSWSDRIWSNISQLQQELNENLIDCVLTGKSTEDLKKRLVERFGVSYNRADSIVRTEYTHIQTEAAKQRYKDTGVKQVQVWADYDERRCDVCGDLHMKYFPVNSTMPIPAHPRCRCCIIPVVEVAGTQMEMDEFYI